MHNPIAGSQSDEVFPDTQAHCIAKQISQLSSLRLRLIVRHFRQGGLLAYPTEAVFGLGCDPRNATAVNKLLQLKKRAMHKGLILLAASFAQLEDYVAPLGPAHYFA